MIYLALTAICFSAASSRKGFTTAQFALIFLALALFVGLGDMLGGYDRYSYGDMFDRGADDVMAGKDVFAPDGFMNRYYSSEKGYMLWNVFCAHLTLNRYIFILMTTLLIYVLVFWSFKDTFRQYPFALLMFMGLWYFFTYTYLRQAVATGITWVAYRYIQERKLLPYLMCCAIAYQFHNSAIIFLPLYFIPARKWKREQVIVVMVVLAAFGMSGLPTGLYSLYGDLADATGRTDEYVRLESSTRIDYIIEVVTFLYFIFQRYECIPNDRRILIFLNASFVFCGVLLFFIRSSSAGRQSWYYLFGIIFILSYLMKRERGITNYTLSILAIVSVLFLRIVILWGVLLYPYKTFLTDGYRPGDTIHDMYEYDSNYDNDKFYRDPWILW